MSRGTVEACPECDAARVRLLTSRVADVDETHPRYRCATCGNRFNEPHTRPSKNNSPGVSGSQKTLWQADPDEFDLRADGGTRCPECGGVLAHRQGCTTCLECGYSACGGAFR